MDIDKFLTSAETPVSLKELILMMDNELKSNILDDMIKTNSIGAMQIGSETFFWKKNLSYDKSNVHRIRDINEIRMLESDLELLKEKYMILKSEKNLLSDEEMKNHIKRLHDYNEVKDEGIKIVEKVAMIEGRSVKQIYKKMDIDDSMFI